MTALPDRRVLRRVRGALLEWYATNHRDFPWRRTTDPYAVLVSEVMLQQTQASRVVERFERFMGRFPTAASLAAAPSGDVLAEWSGLGYNRRALALQRAAVAVTAHGWPTDVAGLAALPGVGPYTARAVASLAFGGAGRRGRHERAPLAPPPLRRPGSASAAPGPGRCRSRRPVARLPRGPTPRWSSARPSAGREPHAAIPAPIARGCPSRGRAGTVAVPRQAALRGTDRAYRGAVLRLLSTATRHARAERALCADLARDAGRIGPALDTAGWERVMGALERDGLVHRSGGVVRLGAARIGA